MRLDDTVVGCRLQECNMDVVIIYSGKFSVSRKIRMQVLCHTGSFPSTGGSRHNGVRAEEISAGNNKTDSRHL